MAVRHLEVEVRRETDTAVLDLRGEINGFAEEALNAAYAEAEATDPGTILLNFERVDYINSTGIALIVGLLAKARASRRRLLAYGLSDHYVEIFDITRLSDFMSVFPDEQSAINSSQLSAVSSQPRTAQRDPNGEDRTERDETRGVPKASEGTADYRRKADS